MPSSFELREPTATEDLLPGDPAPWIWGGMALAALALLTLLVRHFRKSRKPHPAAARNAAFRSALDQFAALNAPAARAAAVQSSLILRTYLSVAANDPALFETQEEFIARSDALTALTPSARDACHEGFSQLASLKYGPVSPTADASQVVKQARELLETLHRGFAA